MHVCSDKALVVIHALDSNVQIVILHVGVAGLLAPKHCFLSAADKQDRK